MIFLWWLERRVPDFFPRGVWFYALHAPSSTNTYTSPYTHFPPLAHLSSQVRQAHWGPWGGETKMIIGSSLSLTALCASHIWSILWWQAVPKRLLLSGVIHETSSKGSGAIRDERHHQVWEGRARETVTLIWSEVTYCAVIEFSEVLKNI